MDHPDYIAELTKDWLDRDGTTFVHKRKTDRLDWDQELESKKGYSSFLLSAPSELQLIKRAYPIAKNILVAMNLPHKVELRTSRSSSYTDSRRVFVATKVFDEKGMEPEQKLDVFLGYTVHEGSHVLYTNFSCSPSEGHTPTEKKWIQHLSNIIEDEYIEQRLGDEKPGYANFLEAAKRYSFGRYDKELEKETDPEEKRDRFIELLNAFLYLVRYPARLTEETIEEYGEYLLQARNTLMPYPVCTEESYMAAEKIFDIFKEFLKDEKRRQEENQDGNDDNNGSGDKSQDPTSDGNPGEPSDGGDDSASEQNDSETDDDESQDGTTPGAGTDTDDDDAEELNDLINIILTDELSKIEKALIVLSPDASADRDFEDVADIIKKDDYISDIIEGTMEEGSTEDVVFIKEDDNKEQYLDDFEEIKKYIAPVRASIRSHFKDYRFVRHDQKHGKLESRKLADAFMGSRTVYLRKGEVNTDKIAVCILIDESGSMSCSGRMKAARRTAILLNEALKGIPDIDLFIYGHTGDILKSGSTEIHVYRENGHRPPFALGNSVARCENRDGLAILETARRVRKQTERPVLMFIISDGEPCADNYSGWAAIRDTKEKVKETERLGFSPVQICINSSYNPANMFDHFIKLENMDTLAISLTQTVKEALKRNTKSHTR